MNPRALRATATFLRLAFGQAIDDAALALAGLEEAQHLLHCAGLFGSTIADVGAVEAGDEAVLRRRCSDARRFRPVSARPPWRSVRCAARRGRGSQDSQSAGIRAGNHGPIAKGSAPRRWRSVTAARISAGRGFPASKAFPGPCRAGPIRPARCRARAGPFPRPDSRELSAAAFTPACLSAATWSSISAMRGEMTRPMPGRAKAGIW